jgi:hypothetical protein
MLENKKNSNELISSKAVITWHTDTNGAMTDIRKLMLEWQLLNLICSAGGYGGK